MGGSSEVWAGIAISACWSNPTALQDPLAHASQLRTKALWPPMPQSPWPDLSYPWLSQRGIKMQPPFPLCKGSHSKVSRWRTEHHGIQWTVGRWYETHTQAHTPWMGGGSSPNWMGPRSISRMAVSVAVSPWQSPKCGQGDPSPGKEGLQDSPKQLPWEWLSGSSQEGDTRSSPILPPPQSQALWLPLPPNPVPYPPITPPFCETNCSQRAPLPAALPLWSSRWPPHTHTLGGGKNGDGEGRGFSSQAGKQGLLKWPQQACWYLKDSGEGGGQRLGGSLPGGWWRSWGWG